MSGSVNLSERLLDLGNAAAGDLRHGRHQGARIGMARIGEQGRVGPCSTMRPL